MDRGVKAKDNFRQVEDPTDPTSKY